MVYSGPVIDTHHHIWLRKDVTWLADPPVPRMFGDYLVSAAITPLKSLWMTSDRKA
jgi:predicted TIM-barrel fold metal-dependent hydrolase